MVRHHFRYSIEYLAREGYIGLDGQPRDLCGLVNHLYFLEPANYVFVSLLKGGLFDDFCKQTRKDKDHVLQLLIVLANLFSHVKLHPSQRRSHKGSSSVVVLPALPKAFIEGIEYHNRRALQTASTYVRAFAKAYHAELGEDATLPLSHVVFIPKSLQAGGAKGSSGSNSNSNSKGAKGKKEDEKKVDGKKDGSPDDLFSVLKASATEYYARSTFSALSGKGDKFDNVAELSESLRKGVSMDRNLVPTMEIEPGKLNAYIIDLYNHKSTKSLIKYNHVRRDTLYDNLKNFMLVCIALATALAKRAPVSIVSTEFKLVADEFSAIFNEFGHLH
jgi:hypothetical protein